jgi:ribosomal protein S18 acetylase RimI-like enzyme
VLGRALPFEPSAPLPHDVAIARCAPHESGAWLEVVVAGFASPDVQGVASHESFPRDAIERAVEDVAATRGFVRYIARRDGEPAGGASMRLCDGIAQMCGAATLPAHRRRGIQSALLAARLVEATHAGCELAVVTTLPGLKSMQNVQREGFELLYARAVLVRAR